MRYVENEEHRQSIISMLNHKQRDVLYKYHRKTKSSILQNEIIQKTDDWELKNIKIGAYYRDKTKDKEEKLYCQCGAELKYQHVLLDKRSGEIIGLGETCFEKYTGISKKVAQQIQMEQFSLDEWLDDILLTFKEHKQGIELKAQYQQTIDTFMTKTNNAPIEQRIPLKQGVITEKDLKLFHDFKDVGLPLPTKLYNKIEQALQSYKEKEIAEAREKILWEKIKSSKHLYKAQTSKKKEYREAIADCRIAMDKLLNKGEEIPFNTLYLRAREPMEKLFKEFEKEKVIQLVANSVNQYSNNKVSIDWVAKAFIRTGKKI